MYTPGDTLRKLDALVAKTLGWTNVEEVTHSHTGTSQLLGVPPSGGHRDNVPEYSTDIRAAYEIAELINQRGGWNSFLLQTWPLKGWKVKIEWVEQKGNALDSSSVGEALGETIPIAICLAFLRAKGVPQSEIDEAIK